MSTSPVLRLDDYRERRDHRLRLTRALHGACTERRRLLDLLESAAGLLEADRAAVLWVDEYGAGLVHVHLILDLVADRPRRSFALEPLRRAWQAGVPGILDAPDLDRAEIPVLGDAARSTCAIALGSDGARAWFLVADGTRPRRPMEAEAGQALMFVAGEVAAVVLHRDLENEGGEAPAGEQFAGWAVLRDVEGREDDAEAGRRISARFLVVRALLSVVNDGFATDPEGLAHQIAATRRELDGVLEGDAEREAWLGVLDALEAPGLERLAGAVHALAREVDERGHMHGAGTLYRAAYEAALAAGAPGAASEAGRFLGRLERRRGAWDRAIRWYGTIRDVARERGDRATEAVVLSGHGNVLRSKGNLPAARSVFEESLEAARASGDAYALGSAHHDLMAVEQDLGGLGRAIVHGWRAVEVYPDEESRLKAMTALAGCFLQTGELDAADDAYAIVAARVGSADFRLAALEALANVAARRGDGAAFEARAAASDAAGWAREASVWTRAQILLFRGLSHAALGRTEEARRWLERARVFAAEQDVNKVMFEAETALEGLDGTARQEETPAEEARAPHEEMPAIRRGLSAMREALVAV